jgi:endonuclease YncB( thermonuclease family)
MSTLVDRRSAATAILAVLVLLLLIRLVACAPATPADPADASGGAADVESPASFVIAGDTLETMTPGAMVPIDLALTNPHEFPISVTDLTVEIRLVQAPNADKRHLCTVADFTVHQASGTEPITVAASSTSTLSALGLRRQLWPHIGMLNRPVNQDGCMGAALGLGYAGSGTAAH